MQLAVSCLHFKLNGIDFVLGFEIHNWQIFESILPFLTIVSKVHYQFKIKSYI